MERRGKRVLTERTCQYIIYTVLLDVTILTGCDVACASVSSHAYHTTQIDVPSHVVDASCSSPEGRRSATIQLFSTFRLWRGNVTRLFRCLKQYKRLHHLRQVVLWKRSSVDYVTSAPPSGNRRPCVFSIFCYEPARWVHTG